MKDIKKAFKEGYFAARDGVVVGKNPYPETEEAVHWQWMSGWMYFHTDAGAK